MPVFTFTILVAVLSAILHFLRYAKAIWGLFLFASVCVPRDYRYPRLRPSFRTNSYPGRVTTTAIFLCVPIALDASYFSRQVQCGVLLAFAANSCGCNGFVH